MGWAGRAVGWRVSLVCLLACFAGFYFVDIGVVGVDWWWEGQAKLVNGILLVFLGPFSHDGVHCVVSVSVS